MSHSFMTLWTAASQAPVSMGFPRQEYRSGLLVPFPGNFLTQASNPCLMHCKQILYHGTTRGAMLYLRTGCCSVSQSRLTLCDSMDCSMLGFPEFAQTHVHWMGDALQPSHPLLSPSSPAFSLSQNQGLF